MSTADIWLVAALVLAFIWFMIPPGGGHPA